MTERIYIDDLNDVPGPDPDEQPGDGWMPMNDIEVVEIEWLDEDQLLQANAFHLLGGIKNAGKGTLLSWMGARFTRGELGGKRNVLWITIGEDSPSIDVKPRLLAAGAVGDHIHIKNDYTFVLPEGAAELERKAEEVGDVGLIVIDPVGGALKSGKSTNLDADIRHALQALNTVADTLKCVIIGVRHFSIKGAARQHGALSAFLGSSDFVHIPRAVLGIFHDDEETDDRHLFVLTGNRSRGDAPGLRMRVEGHRLPGHKNEVTKMVHVGPSDKIADELIQITKKKGAGAQTGKAAARELILELLGQAPGYQIESDELERLVNAETGLAAKSIRNLRGEMKNENLVKSVPQKDETGAVQRWFVTLTDTGAAVVNAPEPDQRPTHNMKGSGLDKPEPLFPVSGDGQEGHWEPDQEKGDFVTPSEAPSITPSVPQFGVDSPPAPGTPGAPAMCRRHGPTTIHSVKAGLTYLTCGCHQDDEEVE